MTDVKMGAETPRPIFAPKRTAEEKLFVYSYQCKKCGVQYLKAAVDRPLYENYEWRGW